MPSPSCRCRGSPTLRRCRPRPVRVAAAPRRARRSPAPAGRRRSARRCRRCPMDFQTPPDAAPGVIRRGIARHARSRGDAVADRGSHEPPAQRFGLGCLAPSAATLRLRASRQCHGQRHPHGEPWDRAGPHRHAISPRENAEHISSDSSPAGGCPDRTRAPISARRGPADRAARAAPASSRNRRSCGDPGGGAARGSAGRSRPPGTGCSRARRDTAGGDRVAVDLRVLQPAARSGVPGVGAEQRHERAESDLARATARTGVVRRESQALRRRPRRSCCRSSLAEQHHVVALAADCRCSRRCRRGRRRRTSRSRSSPRRGCSRRAAPTA